MPKSKRECGNCFYWQEDGQAPSSECFSSREVVGRYQVCEDFTPCNSVNPPPPWEPVKWFRDEADVKAPPKGDPNLPDSI